MPDSLPAEEMLALARFQILDSRNSSEGAKDKLFGVMADAVEAERLKRQQAEHERDCAVEQVAALIAECEHLRSQVPNMPAVDVPAAPKQCACDQPYAETCMAAYWRAGICCRLTGETTQGTRGAE